MLSIDFTPIKTQNKEKNINREEVNEVQRRTMTNSEQYQRFVNLKTAAAYLGVGTHTAKATAVKIGAEKRIGKRCIYDLQAIDEYFSCHDTLED